MPFRMQSVKQTTKIVVKSQDELDAIVESVSTALKAEALKGDQANDKVHGRLWHGSSERSRPSEELAHNPGLVV